MPTPISDGRGASGVEYGIMAAAIAATIVAGAYLLGSSVSGMFDNVENLLDTYM